MRSFDARAWPTGHLTARWITDVQAFAPVDTFDSLFGEVRVWRGNLVGGQVSSP